MICFDKSPLELPSSWTHTLSHDQSQYLDLQIYKNSFAGFVKNFGRIYGWKHWKGNCIWICQNVFTSFAQFTYPHLAITSAIHKQKTWWSQIQAKRKYHSKYYVSSIFTNTKYQKAWIKKERKLYHSIFKQKGKIIQNITWAQNSQAKILMKKNSGKKGNIIQNITQAKYSRR